MEGCRNCAKKRFEASGGQVACLPADSPLVETWKSSLEAPQEAQSLVCDSPDRFESKKKSAKNLLLAVPKLSSLSAN